MTSTRPQKANVPSPLPRHRGTVNIPNSLTASIQTALISSDRAIPRIQTGMAAALTTPYASSSTPSSNTDSGSIAPGGEEGWIGVLGVWLARQFEEAEERGESVSDEAMLQRVLEGLRDAGSDQPRDGGEDNGALLVPEQAVNRMIEVVRKELEKCCVLVDGEGWVG